MPNFGLNLMDANLYPTNKKSWASLVKKKRKKSLEHAFGFGYRYIPIRIQKFWDPNPDLYAFLSEDLNIDFTVSTKRTKKIVWS